MCTCVLYYIVSLHQTTTPGVIGAIWTLLYYIVSLHQTTTGCRLGLLLSCCIISFLYIKPQPFIPCVTSTSCCIISFLYIKPQPPAVKLLVRAVVLYRFSTSNHNFHHNKRKIFALYYIVSLHQTTTYAAWEIDGNRLYYIVSLHQTTTFID